MGNFDSRKTILGSLGASSCPTRPVGCVARDATTKVCKEYTSSKSTLYSYLFWSCSALETLARLHADGDKQDPYVLKQYNEIIEQIKWEDQNAVHSYIEVFKSPSIRKRVCLAAGMQTMQQWTGINAVLYYAPFIFKSAGMTDNLSTLLATGVNGIVCVIFTIPAIMFIDKWGRKNTLLAGGFGMGISMMIAGALLKGNFCTEAGTFIF